MLLMESDVALREEDPGSRVSQMETRGSFGTVWVTAVVAGLDPTSHMRWDALRVRDMAETSKIW